MAGLPENPVCWALEQSSPWMSVGKDTGLPSCHSSMGSGPQPGLCSPLSLRREESCEDPLSVCPAMRSSTNAPSVPTYRSHPCRLPSLFPSPGSRARLCSPLAEGRLQVGEPCIIRGAPLLPPGTPQCPDRGPSHADGGPSASALGDVGKGVWPAKPRNDRPAMRGLDWRLQTESGIYIFS